MLDQNEPSHPGDTPRPHRRSAEWAIAPTERSVLAAGVAAEALGDALARSEPFVEAVAGVALGTVSAHELGRRYVRYSSRGQRVIELVIDRGVAAARSGLGPTRLIPAMIRNEVRNLPRASWWADASLEAGSRARWIRSNARYDQAAEMVADRGAGVCMNAGCLERPRARNTYCAIHGLDYERSRDNESVRGLLRAAARGLGVE